MSSYSLLLLVLYDFDTCKFKSIICYMSYLQTALSHVFNFSIAKFVGAASERLKVGAFAKTQFSAEPWNRNAIRNKNKNVKMNQNILSSNNSLTPIQ